MSDNQPFGLGTGVMHQGKHSLSFFQVIGSVFASFFGVQSSEKRQRDFSQGRARDFIVAGILITVLFVLLVWGIVKLVTSLAVA
jgi:hypothetical protein